jgi:hypothetical protein
MKRKGNSTMVDSTASAVSVADPANDMAQAMRLPSDDGFEGEDWQEAPELRAIARELINAHERFFFLRTVDIDYLWKRKGGMMGGEIMLGGTQRTPSLAKMHTGTDFTVYFSVDICKMVMLTRQQAYAHMYHLLRHLRHDEEKSTVKIQGHAFEGWPDEIEHFGFWRPNVAAIARAVQMRFNLDESPAVLLDGQGEPATSVANTPVGSLFPIDATEAAREDDEGPGDDTEAATEAGDEADETEPEE